MKGAGGDGSGRRAGRQAVSARSTLDYGPIPWVRRVGLGHTVVRVAVGDVRWLASIRSRSSPSPRLRHYLFSTLESDYDVARVKFARHPPRDFPHSRPHPRIPTTVREHPLPISGRRTAGIEGPNGLASIELNMSASCRSQHPQHWTQPQQQSEAHCLTTAPHHTLRPPFFPKTPSIGLRQDKTFETSSSETGQRSFRRNSVRDSHRNITTCCPPDRPDRQLPRKPRNGKARSLVGAASLRASALSAGLVLQHDRRSRAAQRPPLVWPEHPKLVTAQA